MSSAIATLMDWDFEPLTPSQWIDPTGSTWIIDYDAPSCIGLAKEVLEHHFLRKIWTSSTTSLADDRPCLQVYRSLARKFQRNRDHRKLYFLEAIAQGAMDFHAEARLSYDVDTGMVVCSQCCESIGGESAWMHFALECSFTCNGSSILETDPCSKCQLLKDRARHEATIDQDKAGMWLNIGRAHV